MSIKLRQLLYFEQESGIGDCGCPSNVQARPSHSTPHHAPGEKCVALASPVTHASTCSQVAVNPLKAADGAAEPLRWGQHLPGPHGRRALTQPPATGRRP